MMSDVIFNVNRGQTLTAKHVSLGHGIHTMTGQKNLVAIANGLGHCIPYNKVIDIEAKLAEKADSEIVHGVNTILPLVPSSGCHKVKSVCWVNNFDKVNILF